MKFLKHSICLVAFSLVACAHATAADSGNSTNTLSADALNFWPQWRGPLANGSAPQANPPTEWSEDRNVRWKLELPGKGHSSPVVWGDFVFVTAAVPFGEAVEPVYDHAPGTHDNVGVTQKHRFVLMAVNRRDGKILWNKTVREEFPHEGGHMTGSLASNSPVTDGETVFASFGSRGLYAFDFKGELKWKKDLGKMETLHAHGEGSSPVIHGDWLILNWDHEKDSYLYAFDKRTGEQRWKISRDDKTSWSTPIIVIHEGRPQVIISATKRVRGYDLLTGSQIWECAGLSRNVVCSPVAANGMVFAANSYDWQALLAIRLDGAKGDITDTDRVAWKLNRSTPYVSSPLLYENTLYFLRHNQNILSRYEPATGKPRGEALRLDGIRDFIFSSPVAAAGRIYVTGRDGTTVVLSHDNDNKPLAVNHLNDVFSASAAVAGNELFLRGEQFLYCLAAK
jgi:outer membrane protein assembly factor BamB